MGFLTYIYFDLNEILVYYLVIYTIETMAVILRLEWK